MVSEFNILARNVKFREKEKKGRMFKIENYNKSSECVETNNCKFMSELSEWTACGIITETTHCC